MVWLPRSSPSYVPWQASTLVLRGTRASAARQRCLLHVGIEDSVQSLHAALHVVVYVTMEHPRARHIWNHIGSNELSWSNSWDHVQELTADVHQISVPVRSVKIEPHSHRHHVPTHVFAFAHGHDGAIAVHVAVDCVLEVAHRETTSEGDVGIALGVRRYKVEPVELGRMGDMGFNVLVEVLALVFVHDHEKREELVI